MAELVVVGFQDRYRASQVINELRRSAGQRYPELDRAVAVELDEAGGVQVEQRVHPVTGEGIGWGQLWGSLLGATMLLPIGTGCEAVPRWWTDELGVPDQFLRDIGALLEPGDSAIFLLVPDADSPIILDRLRRNGGLVLRAVLNPAQEARVQTLVTPVTARERPPG